MTSSSLGSGALAEPRPRLPRLTLTVPLLAWVCLGASALGQEPGPPFGNDDGICWLNSVCSSGFNERICGTGPVMPGSGQLDGPAVGPTGPIAQGQAFLVYSVHCGIARWRVDVTTRTPRIVGRAYDGTAYPNSYQAVIPACQPPGEAWVTLAGWAADDSSPYPTHWRNSESFTITPGSQACVYSADVNPRSLLQGDAQVVFWSAPNNQAYARAYLRYASGGVVDMRPYGGGQDGYFGGVSNSTQQFQWNIPATLPPGSYVVRVRAYNSGGQYKENDTPTVTVGPRPTVANVLVSPATVYTGQPVAVSWTSTNQASWQVYACTSTSSCIGPVVSSTSGTATAQSTTWTPSASQTGTFKMKVRVTASSNAWAESTSTASVLVKPRPQATIQWQFYDSQITEGGASVPVPLAVKVTTSTHEDTISDATVSFQAVASTATGGADFTVRQGTILIPAGTHDLGVVSLPSPQIQVLADTLDENTERFFVDLTGISGSDAQLGSLVRHTVDILDDPADLPPVLSVSDSSVTEGNSGSLNAIFTVSLSAASGRNVGFSVGTADGSATAGADYTAVAGARTINAGQSTLQVQVPVLGDLLDETDETFLLNLSAPQNASLGDAQGVGTIVDNDLIAVSVGAAQPTVSEGGGSALVTVQAVPAGGLPLTSTVTAQFATTDGSAVAGADYTGTSGTLTFSPAAPGPQTVAIALLNDTVDEPDQTFSLALTGVAGGTLVSPSAQTVTIQDDDPAPLLSLSDPVVTEGSAGITNVAFTATLDRASEWSPSFGFATASGSATSGVDFYASNGSRSFDAAVPPTPVTLNVGVVADRLPEPTETFSLALSSPSNLVVGTGGTATLVDDDTPGLSVDDVSVREGLSANVAVRLAPAAAGPVDVDWQSLAGSATAGSDFTPASGTAHFDVGSSVAMVSVPTVADASPEGVETFTLQLANPVGAAIASGTGQVKIVDAELGTDFDGDLRGDLLWRETGGGSGAAKVWFMNGATRLSEASLVPNGAPLEWRIAGTGSFHPGGRNDILWQNETSKLLYVWRMTDLVGDGTLTTPGGMADLDYLAAATGDFNQDGKTDILWSHQLTGKLQVWLMNGVEQVGGGFTTPDGVANLNWQVSGTADLNQDGKPDILWRNTDSGRFVVWLMDGLVRTSGAFLVPEAQSDLAWRVVSSRDLDGDGKSDLIWRNSNSGRLVVWWMDGLYRRSGTFVSPDGAAEVGWIVAGPK